MDELVPLWMKRFEQQDLDEEKETIVKLLNPKARHFMWWLCKQYKFMGNGVMGQACCLLERYMAKKSLSFFFTAPRLLVKRRRVNHDISNRIPLLASVCVALTTKMMSSETQLDGTTIKNVLLRLNVNVSLAIINSTELDVLATLGFCIPMFTNVEKAMTMAFDVGMSSTLILQGVALVTELAEYYRSSIQQEVINVAFSIRTDKDEPIRRNAITNVRHIHLVAGAIISTSVYLKHAGPDPIPRLCFLTQTNSLYIKCVGDIIYKQLVTSCGPPSSGNTGEPSDGEPSTSKRKLSED